MAASLSLVFFLSGAAALLFEALWLRRAGLMLGSSVWASSIVLASFMTGLAVGNALAVRWAARLAARGESRTEPFGVDSGRMQGAAKRRILEVFKRAATQPRGSGRAWPGHSRRGRVGTLPGFQAR